MRRGTTEAPLVRGTEVPWLQPFPDSLLWADTHDPSMQAIQRETLRLAFVAALQHIPARQHAVLIIRDVLMWSAAEVAEALDTTTVRGEQRTAARARIRIDEMGLSADEVAEPSKTASLVMVERYLTAFNKHADIAALTRLLTDDVVMEMPPIRNWFHGPENFGRFIARSYSIPAASTGE